MAKLFQRVRKQVRFEERRHGASQSDIRRGLLLAGRIGEHASGPLVVEQDAALRVADNHALGQLRHECTQAVSLLVGIGARLRDARLHVAQRLLVPCGEQIDRAGELAQLARTVRTHAMPRIAACDESQRLAQAMRRCEISAGKTVCEQAGEQEDDETRNDDHTGRGRQHLPQGCVLLGNERTVDHEEERRARPGGEGEAGAPHEREAALHGATPADA